MVAQFAAAIAIVLLIAFIIGCAIEQITPEIHVIEVIERVVEKPAPTTAKSNKSKPKPTPRPARPTPTSQPAPQQPPPPTPPPPEVDETDKQALEETAMGLRSLGFPAKTAKAMAEGTSGTVEQRIKQALNGGKT